MLIVLNSTYLSLFVQNWTVRTRSQQINQKKKCHEMLVVSFFSFCWGLCWQRSRGKLVSTLHLVCEFELTSTLSGQLVVHVWVSLWANNSLWGFFRLPVFRDFSAQTWKTPDASKCRVRGQEGGKRKDEKVIPSLDSLFDIWRMADRFLFFSCVNAASGSGWAGLGWLSAAVLYPGFKFPVKQSEMSWRRKL